MLFWKIAQWIWVISILLIVIGISLIVVAFIMKKKKAISPGKQKSKFDQSRKFP